MSADLSGGSDSPLSPPARAGSQALEGIGTVDTWCVDVTELDTGVPGEPTVLGRLGRTLAVVGTGLPYMVGLRRRRHRQPA